MTTQAQYLDGTDLQQVLLDPELTTDCAIGAISAYDDFAGKKWSPPPGFKYLGRFTGWARYLVHKGEVERFGLIFQHEKEPDLWLVAFRGTASLLDGYEDLWANTVNFKPHGANSNFPKDVAVASGFNSIYTEKGGDMELSMQGQIFRAIDISRPSRVLITGHSLGGALASLFALDVAASRPDIQVFNTTFASPRVGKSVWQSTYEKKFDLLGTTFRIANYWDYVPSLPPETFFGYKHVGERFLASFYVKHAVRPYLVPRHAMKNYQLVLGNAVRRKPQVWESEFIDQSGTGYTMVSTAPPTKVVPELEVLQQVPPEELLSELL